MSTSNESKKHYWFPAKRYGLGWGFPSAWQGWLILLIYLGAISFSAYVFSPSSKTTSFLLATIAISVTLIVICWIKGEPPKWRWGKR